MLGSYGPTLKRTSHCRTGPLRPGQGLGTRLPPAPAPQCTRRHRQAAASPRCQDADRTGRYAKANAAPAPALAPAVVMLQRAVRRVGGLALGAATAALLLVSAPSDAEDTQILRFPASADPDVFGVQRTLVQAWQVVRDVYVDGSYGGTDWDEELEDALTSAFLADDGQLAYGEIERMLGRLGDPYTRIVPPTQYSDFRVSSEGEVQGVGLLIAADQPSGKLVVLAPIRGSPADRAGLKPGDLVVSINGAATDGWDSDHAAKVLRGKSGSRVTVRFARRTDQVPGVPGRPEEPPNVEYKQVQLRRERVELSPVYSTSVHHAGRLFGYIRLMSFSQHAGQDMAVAIRDLQGQGVQGFILDLRNNGGGLVRSGMDVARLWMDGEAPVFNVIGRTPPPDEDLAAAASSTPATARQQVAQAPPPATTLAASLQQRQQGQQGGAQGTATMGSGGAGRALGEVDVREVVMQQVVLEGGNAATHLPLTVLINEGSASASEILAGALHDNARADLIGRTSYGKGRIQSVYELQDGSALFVTVAKYKTPSMQEIDRVGIRPDLACEVPPLRAASTPSHLQASTQPRGASTTTPGSGADGPPGSGPGAGADATPGSGPLTRLLPYGAALASDSELEEELEMDGCVLAAEHVLESKVPLSFAPGLPSSPAAQDSGPSVPPQPRRHYW